MYVKVILNIKVKKQASPQWMAVAVGICVQTYLETNLNISILGVFFSDLTYWHLKFCLAYFWTQNPKSHPNDMKSKL